MGKSVSIVAIVAILVSAGLASAALLSHYGKITTTVNVQQSVLVDGGDYLQPITYDGGTVAGNTITDGPHTLLNQADVPVDVTLETIQTGDGTPDNNVEGITTTYWKVPDTSEINIDGVISEGEWDGAVSIPVDGGMGTVKVLATTNYLYVLFDLVDSNDARTQYVNEVGNDQISININPTDGGNWGFPYDLIFETSALSGGGCACNCPADGGHHCLPWNPKVNSGTSSDGWATRWFPNDAQDVLPSDLESATVYSGGRRITEWKIPLASIGVSLGNTLKIGGAIDVGDGKSYVYPIGLDWNDANTYVGLIIGTQIPESTLITLQPGELLNFYIVNAFDAALVPGTYTITTTVVPA